MKIGRALEDGEERRKRGDNVKEINGKRRRREVE